jgi:nitrogen-specific signal transduction histidine kinase
MPGKSGVDVFTTLRRDPELGLFTANKVVEKHHGRIDVESRPGEGTRFTVRIPRAMRAQSDAPVSAGSEQSPEEAKS